MPKALPGYCGGRLPGRSTKEKGREEQEEEEDSRERQKLGMKSLNKWFRALRRRHGRMKMPAKYQAELGLFANR